MAYVRQANLTPEKEEKDKTAPMVIGGGGSGAVVEQSSGAAPPVSPNAQTQSTGTFPNLQRYLSANQYGAQNLGAKVAGDINRERQEAESGIAGAANTFGGKVQQGTTVWNPNLVEDAARNASNYLGNTDLQKQLSGQYAGPTDFSGSEEAGTARKEIQEAAQKAALTGNVGGRTQLLRSVLSAPGTNQSSAGGMGFNQFLLQNTAPALQQVQAAGKAVEPLGEQYVQKANEIQQSVQQAQDTSAAARQQALQRLSQGNTDLQSMITQAQVARQAQLNDPNRDERFRSFLAGLGDQVGEVFSGLGRRPLASKVNIFTQNNPAISNTLRELGLNDNEIQSLIEAQSLAKGEGVADLDISRNLVTSTPGMVGTADVASEKQKADLNALAQFLQQNSNFLQSGYQGTGPRLDLGSAIGGLNSRYGQAVAARQAREAAEEAARQEAARQAAARQAAEAEAARQAAAQQAAAAQNPYYDYGGSGPGNAGPGPGSTVGGGISGIGIGIGNAIGGMAGLPGLGSIANALVGNIPSSIVGPGDPNAPVSSVPGFAAGEGPSAAAPGSPGTTAEGNSGISGNPSGGENVGESGVSTSSGGDGGGGGGGKIICTAMNNLYGLPYNENKVWLKYSVTHMTPEHQAGYHKVFLPLVDFAFKRGNGKANLALRKVLIWVGRERTKDIQDELAGRNPRWIKRALIRKPLEKLMYQIGKWSKK